MPGSFVQLRDGQVGEWRWSPGERGGDEAAFLSIACSMAMPMKAS
jgi:hypothetical protein